MRRALRPDPRLSGSGEAFEQFFARWRPVVWSAARELLPCDGDADDALQRVMFRSWTMLHAVLLALFLAAPWHAVRAQTVQGTVTQREPAIAVAGALVVLLDQAGAARARSLTDEDGRFLLQAPGPGRYDVRIERIGYATHTSEPLTLTLGATQDLRVVVDAAPILLDEIRVEARQRCEIRGGQGPELAAVWDQARKALAIQDWTAEAGLLRFQVSHWERDLDPRARIVRTESRRVERYLSRNPIRTLPPDDLLSGGFVRPTEAGGHVYYGPDAALLLSDAFLDGYCFSLAEHPDIPDHVGLAFQPVQPSRADVPPGIRGTLWLERTTARLQYLDFGYTWTPWPEARDVAGGRVYFEESPGGGWFVRRWWIRMPRVDLAPGIQWGRGLRMAGVREEGAEVTGVEYMGRPMLTASPRATLAGRVHDSIAGGPLAGATVFLAGSDHWAVTDSLGRFALDTVPAGLQQVAFAHPSLEALQATPAEVQVFVRPGVTTIVNLAGPSARGVLEAHCGSTDGGAPVAAVVGTVRSDLAGDPIPGASVVLRWPAPSRPGAARDPEGEAMQGTETATDDAGRFRVCGIPAGVEVTVAADDGRYRSSPAAVRAGPGSVAVVDLVTESATDLPAAHPATATSAPRCPTPEPGSGVGVLEGNVTEGGTGVALGFAAVRLMPSDSGQARATRADAGGRFHFCDVPAGDWGVEGWLADYRGGPERVSVAGGRSGRVALELSFAPTGRTNGALRGHVISRESGGPMDAVVVEIVGTAHRTLTGPDGAFAFRDVDPGEVTLRATHLGYAVAEGAARVGPGEAVEVEIALTTEAIPVDPITVTVSGRSLPLWEIHGLDRRIRSGWGTIILQEEIQQRAPSRVWDLLAEAGIDVHDNGKIVRVRRTKCRPVLYLDGHRFSERGDLEYYETLRMIPPTDLYAIEVYRGPAGTPSQYIDKGSRCGVILIWTHRGAGG
jgi:hypothetical protein